MQKSIVAGFAYFIVIFTVGFALGTLRVMILIPGWGEAPAVLFELPIILALSWIACRWIARWFEAPPTSRDRFVMGSLAFALLMLAEFGVSVFGFERTLSKHLASYRQLLTLLGLTAQLAFAAIPVFQDAAATRSRE